MVDFKKLLSEAAEKAASLPSFPQKGVTYHINAQNPDFSPYEDWVEETRFGKPVKRKQTLFRVNTQEGLLRISPKQMQQLQECLSATEVRAGQEWVVVQTSNTEGEALEFEPVEQAAPSKKA